MELSAVGSASVSPKKRQARQKSDAFGCLSKNFRWNGRSVFILFCAAGFLFVGNRNLFRGDGFALHGEDGEGDLLIEPPLAAAAGVQPEAAVDFLLRIFVGMAEDHRVDAGEVFGYELFVMNHKKAAVLDGNGQRFGEMRRPFLIVVAPDHGNGGDFCQLVEDGLSVDIAAVKNGVTAPDRL